MHQTIGWMNINRRFRLGIYYPRGATVGGSAIANAMNVVLPPDSDWNHFAEVTGDKSWGPENMRLMFIELERNTYTPEGTLGHGFDGYVSVRGSSAAVAIQLIGNRRTKTTFLMLSIVRACFVWFRTPSPKPKASKQPTPNKSSS